MVQKVQIKRTSTANSPPGSLDPGELSIEMGNPARLWVGVPAAQDPSGKKLISSNVIVSDTPPSPNSQGTLWWESDTGILWLWYDDGNSQQWVQAAGSSGGATGDFVEVAGDTMTGDLLVPNNKVAAGLVEAIATSTTGTNINCRDPVSGRNIALGISATSAENGVASLVNNQYRWVLQIGNPDPEGGADTGSNFALRRYSDGQVDLGAPIFIERNTGRVIFQTKIRLVDASNRWEDGDLVVSSKGWQPGGLDWADTSDERIKTVHGPYTQGLDAIKRLNPVRYEFKGNDSFTMDASGKPGDAPSTSPHAGVLGKEFVGLVAQQAERPMPEMVTQIPGWIDGKAVDDLRILDTSPLIFALVNSVKELAKEIEDLKARLPQPKAGR